MQCPDRSRCERDITALIAGVAAGAAASGASIALGMVLGNLTGTELVAETITRFTPLPLIDGMTTRFGGSARHILLGSVVAGQIVAAALLSLLAERLQWSFTKLTGAIAGLVVVLGGIIFPPLGFDRSSAFHGFGILALCFVLLHRLMTGYLNPTGIFADEEAASRRAFLRNGTLTIGGAVLGISAFRWTAERLAPPAVPPVLSAAVAQTNVALAATDDLRQALVDGVPGISPEITPNDRFYVVSKNTLRDPSVDSATWQLGLGGLVDRPMTLSYEQLRALPGAEQHFTLQCISNEVGGELIGTAHWRGIWISDLLRQAGVRSDAVDVVFHAADDYSDSIPLVKALQPGTMLAYEMNGEPLPRNHGFPTRLLIPDIYGMKNVKWVTRIEVVGYDYKGYWQTKGWSDVATMRTGARIDIPRPGSYLRPGRNYVGGVALAGQRGISSVEVSVDGGTTWTPAAVKPTLGTNTWSLWLHAWDLPDTSPGANLLVRATDGTGAIQVAATNPAIPDGATGYHTIEVRRAER